MKRRCINIFLFLGLIWSYVYLFYPHREWDYLAPWLGPVDSVYSYTDTGGISNFELKLKPHQLDEWKTMFDEAGIDFDVTSDKFETKTPFVTVTPSGRQVFIETIELFDDHYHRGRQSLWIFYSSHEELGIVLPIQHPDLVSSKLSGVLDGLQMIILFFGTALLVNRFVSPQQSWAFLRGVAFIALLVGGMSFASCLGLSWWSCSNFGNFEIMFSLIIMGGLMNLLLWVIIYASRRGGSQ